MSHDGRLTVVRPSFDCRSKLLKLVSVLVLILALGVGNVWGAYSATFTRINSLSELSDGDSILVVIQDGKTLTSGYAIRNNSTNNAAVTISTTGTPSIACTQADIVWKYVVNSGTPTTYTFQRGTQRIAWTSSTTLSAVATANTYTWTITALSGYTGYFRIKSTGTGTRDIAVDGSHVFKAYANSNYINQMSLATKVALAQYHGAISIYKKGSSCSSPATALSVGATETTIYAGATSTLSTTGGNGSTVTYSVTSDNSAYATISGSTFSATRAGTYTVQASQDDNGGTCGGTSTVNITVRYQVKWSVNGDDSYSTGSPTTYISSHNTKVTTIPTAPTSSQCDGSKVFVGWTKTPIDGTTNTVPSDLFTIQSNSPAITSNTTFYAVFATTGTATFNAADITATPETGNTLEWEHTASGTLLKISAGQRYTGSPNAWNVTAGTSNYMQITAGSGKALTQIVATITGASYKLNTVSTGTLSISSTTQTVRDIRSNTIKCYATSSYQVRITTFTVTYGSAFATSCCTPLGTINGAVNWSNPAEAVVSWNNLANVSSWTVKYKEHGAGAWTTAFTNKTGLDSEITVYSDGGTNNKMKSTITTTCNTAYDFLIIANPESGYCDKEETLENKNSGKWSVAYSLTGVTKSSGPATGANVCGDYTAVFAPSSIAYALPSDVTVQIGGVTKTKDTDYTWDSSTGALSIASAKITGNLSITVTGIEVGCSADPTIGAASLSGAFGLSSVGVTVGSSSTGSAYCAWTDYGFVWGTSANPTLNADGTAPSGVNKVLIGNSDAATTWSGNLTGSFSTGTTYYFCAYGTNSKTGAEPVYGTGSSFTPQRVTFNLNGHGDAIAQQIIDNGSTASEPANPSATGWMFNGWKLNGTTYDFSSAVTGDITLVADWTERDYTVTMAQSPVAGASLTGGTTTAHYGGTINITTTVPDGYTFTGWTASPSVTFANAAATSTSFTMPAEDVTITATFACGVTWLVNGEEWTSGTNAGNTQVATGSRVASLPTPPTNNTLSCANKFMGWSAKNAGSTPKTTSYYDDLFTDVAGSPAITGNTTFYAVFAEQNIYSGRVEVNTTNSGVSGGYSSETFTVDDIEFAYFDWQKSTNIQAKASTSPSLKNNDAFPRRIDKIVVKQSGTARAVSVKGKNFLDSDAATAAGKAFESATITQPTTATTMTFTFPANKSYPFFELNTPGNAVYMDSVVIYYKEIITSNYVTQCDPNIVKVTFDANGGATTCAGGTHDKREDYTVCATEPTRDYYSFAGWLCSADGETYDASATILASAIDANFTLTAQWTPVTYNITYELAGGTNNVGNPATYNVTTATITLQDPTKGHDRFGDWYDNGSFTGDPITSIPLGSHGDITLYAKWAARHEIIFDADGATTTIYRADDEDLSASVAGQGSVPSDPSAPTACSTKVFVGWSESTIDGETDTEPGDLMKPAAGTVNADKHYYAVWAIQSSTTGPVTVFEDALYGKADNNTTFDEYGDWSDIGYVYGCGTSTEGVRVSSADNAGYLQLKANIGLASVDTIKFKIKSYGDSNGGKITLSSYSGAGTYDNGASAVFTTTNTSSWEEQTCILRSADNTTDISFEGSSGKYRVYLKDIKITKAGTVYTYSAYSTSCCATKVTLSQNSPANGTIAFGKTSVGTCGEDKNVSLTITPAAGYQLSSYEVATGSGKVAAKSVSPAIALNNNSSATQNITLTFAEDANGAYDVTAAFSLMTVTSWTWTLNSEAVPNPLNLFVGQSARLDVAYTPAGVDASKKAYTRTKVDAYINWSGAAQATYSTIIGRASTGESTTAVTFTHADGPTTTVNVKVLPLPLVHFADIVHNVVFADVAGTIEANALVKDKTTPTTSDFSGTTYNTCEEQHEHLVGWIESSWADEHPEATHSEIAGAGAGVFYTAGASIDVEAQNGKTFYAVWSKIE